MVDKPDTTADRGDCVASVAVFIPVFLGFCIHRRRAKPPCTIGMPDNGLLISLAAELTQLICAADTLESGDRCKVAVTIKPRNRTRSGSLDVRPGSTITHWIRSL